MPDEEMLALWVEDELSGESAAAVDAWAAGQPEWLARREDARQIKHLLRRANMSAAEEPPYADFFNSRISREIIREAVQTAPAPAREKRGMWRFFLLPAAAMAAMAFCFWAGTRVVPSPAGQPQAAPVATATEPSLYVPEQGVTAAYFTSAPAHAEVIVLDGVAALPDSFEIPDTAAVPEPPRATVHTEPEPQ